MMNPLKLLIVMGGITTILYGCRKDYASNDTNEVKTPIKPVAVQLLNPTSDPIPVEASGILGSKSEVKLSFKVGGIVQMIRAEEGQKVRKGQLLAQLNTAEIDAKVHQAENALEKAQRDLKRAQNLYRDSVITLEQLQDITTVFEVASADLRIATFNQAHAKIVAPEHGRILRRFVEAGELVNGGTPVFLIGHSASDAYIMRVGVADKDVVRLLYRDSAKVGFDAYPGVSFRAFVSEIAESADARTGAFEIELTIYPGPVNLKNGFIGKVKIFPGNQQPYYKIAMNALVEGARQSAGIYVLNEGSSAAKKIAIRPDYIGNDFFTVMATGFDYTRVITDGAAFITDGDDVRIIN
jgi:RND family efflux transporter MFP subunit